MIGSIIAALIGNYMTTCFAIGLVVAAVTVLRQPHRRHRAAPSGTFLDAYVFWAVGISMIVNFVMHSVLGDFAAASIGWAQSPFQLELAVASLGFGVMGVALHGARTQLRAKAALVIANAIFGLGAAGGHVYQIVVNHDHAVNNTGLLLAMDIVVPVVGLALASWRAVTTRPSGSAVGPRRTAPTWSVEHERKAQPEPVRTR